MKKWILLLIVALLIALSLTGTFMSQVEQPSYQVVKTFGDIEIRQYDPMVVAEVIRNGERKESIKEGFRMLADYIFGQNSSSDKIAMTAPVTQNKIGEQWKVHFTMPKGYTIESLPQPISVEVKLLNIPSKRYVVVRFSGLNDDENVYEHLNQLKAFIQEHQLKVTSEPIFAFYNPPWTLSFLRRNEVMLELMAD